MSRINPNRGRAKRYVVLAAVALVPLAVAGLFVGAVSQVQHGVDSIPAAIVNNDTLVTTTAADGTKSQILAGRQLVTELTGKDSAGFDWTITNSRDAKLMLADGQVYAILEVPKDFSKSITSLQSDDPVQADLSIQTDDAHNYLTGSVAQVVGDSLVNTFGKQITRQYVDGLTAGLGGLGDALADSSDGAAKLADGTEKLASGLSQLSDGAGTAQDGANKYADGVGQYTAGVSKLATDLPKYTDAVSSLADGVVPYAEGVYKLSAGVVPYTAGVTQLSSGVKQYVAGAKKIAAGADAYSDGADSARDALVPAISNYSGGVAAVSDKLAAAVADLQANPNDPAALKAVSDQSDALASIADAGGDLSSGASAGLNGLASGAAKLSSGAAALADGGKSLASGAKELAANSGSLSSGAKKLAANSAALAGGAKQLGASSASVAAGVTKLDSGSGDIATGADGLADGFGSLESGASTSASGATKLADGTTKLADGLQSGADQVPSSDSSKQASDVATDPIGLTVQRDNKVSDIGQIIGTLFVPLGLWVGALAVFLVMRPVSRRILSSTVGTGRIALATITRALAVTGIQAVILTIFMHTVLDVRWALLPATFVYSLVMAFAFTGFHYLLTAWLGRAGAIVSIFLLAIQITSTGGLYPIQLLATPFQVISPFLPLTWAVSGMQAIISETGIATVLIVSGGLVLFGIVSLLLTFGAIGRIRRAGALGLVPSHA